MDTRGNGGAACAIGVCRARRAFSTSHRVLESSCWAYRTDTFFSRTLVSTTEANLALASGFSFPPFRLAVGASR